MDELGVTAAHRAEHDIRAQHVLNAADDFRALMNKPVLKNQGHSSAANDLGGFEPRSATFISVVQINHESEQTDISVLPLKRGVGVPAEPLTRCVPVKAESFVQANRGALAQYARNQASTSLSETGCKGAVVEHQTVIVSGG